jgi:regulator of cell morphogenesis and NO signaling
VVTPVTAFPSTPLYDTSMGATTTVFATQTISEIAAQSLGAVRVFESRGIDYCCGGKRPVEEACRELGLNPAEVLAELESAIAAKSADETDWTTASLYDLIRHIVGKHHEYLKLELPLLARRLEKVMKVYGEQDKATLTGLPQLFEGLRSELEMHMHKEEMILFPYVERCESAYRSGAPLPPPPFGSVASPIAVMEQEHDNAGAALKALRTTTNNYAVPEYACVTYRSLLNGLRELEEDLHIHIHLENNILFPRAIALENSAR